MINQDKRKIGYQIRHIRQQKGISIQDVAKRMEVSVSYVYRVEGGYGGYSLETMNKFAAALDVDVKVFYDWREEEKTEGDNTIKDVVAQYGSQLEERIMDLLEQMVKTQQSSPQSQNNKMEKVLTLILQLPSDKQKVIIDRLLAEKFKN